MSIGYACLAVGVPNTGFRTCRQSNASGDTLAALVAHNLGSLENIIEYNIGNRIRLFRISSDVIPFGSSPVNTLAWQSLFAERLRGIGRRIREGGIRVSMHPGQYTVLNAPDAAVALRAEEDLRYHARFLDSLGMGCEHKIVLHIGGAYGDKRGALMRFARRYAGLDGAVRRRLVVENDDRLFTIGDALELGAMLGAPVVYDTLHNAVNRCDQEKSDAHWVAICAGTWAGRDGAQKIHYAQQEPGKKPGSHSATIRIGEFMEFYGSLGERKPDIMLEVKDKNLSAFKCIRSISEP